MKTLLAVSPHLDDAIFSVGALLARSAEAGWRVIVATCFTASVADPTGFALACQLDKGLGPDIDYMSLRREEDRAACRLIGAEAVHLGFPEAPHRGYPNAPALFGPRLPIDHVLDELAETLAALIAAEPVDLLLGPAAIGDHVDHWVTREALARVAPRPPALWADLPYASRQGAALPDRFERLPCGDSLDRKIAAARAYTSQLAFQFGTTDRMASLLSLNGAEALEVSDPGFIGADMA